MTSDGIETADWDRVHELALDIVNASLAGDDAAEAGARTLLLSVLDEFDRKYGRKASLLATRADYVESSEDRERLFLAAYEEAERIGDDTNRGLIAHSLAEFYLDEIKDAERGTTWLGLWRDHLGVEPDEYDREELSRLEGLLLDGGTA